jgi:uncharacterized protein YhbP (UPF0306 family)
VGSENSILGFWWHLHLKKYKSFMEHNIKELIKNVLEKGFLMSLATQDDSGLWVSDVIYVFDDELNIYWMSDPNVRHSQAILKNNKVAGTITISGVGESNLGIQFVGVAEKIKGERYNLAKKHYAKRQKLEPKETDDVLDGDSWYVLKPSKVELIDEKLFGFEKQKLEL